MIIANIAGIHRFIPFLNAVPSYIINASFEPSFSSFYLAYMENGGMSITENGGSRRNRHLYYTTSLSLVLIRNSGSNFSFVLVALRFLPSFPLFEAFIQQVFNLTIDGSKLVLGPGRDFLIHGC